MSLLSQVIRIGKKMTIHIPKDVAERLSLEEGDKLILQVMGGKIILTPIKPPMMRKAWGEVSLKEVEGVGEELTRKAVE